MKKNTLVLCMILFLGTMMPFSAMGADDNISTNTVGLTITSTAQLGIVTSPTVNLALGGATEAGAAVNAVSTNSDSRLRISSLVDNTTRNITAKITADISATNTELWVQLGAPNGNFVNEVNKGTLAGVQNLTSGVAVTVVTGIATCWSGTGADDGYAITYTFNRKSGATSFTSPGNITVTYTLSDI